MSVARNAAAHEAHVAHVAHVAKSALPTRYTVRSGDSLAAISQRFYHNPDAWPVLYWANHHQIHWANEIEIGQVLNVPVKPAQIPSPPALLGPPAAPAPARAGASQRGARTDCTGAVLRADTGCAGPDRARAGCPEGRCRGHLFW